MNKNFIYLFFFLAVLTMCSPHQTSSSDANLFSDKQPAISGSDEEQITALTFRASIISAKKIKQRIFYAEKDSIIMIESENSEEKEREIDSIKRKLDTLKIWIVISDHLLWKEKTGFTLYAPKSRYGDEIDSVTKISFHNWVENIIIDNHSAYFDTSYLKINDYRFILQSRKKHINKNAFIFGRLFTTPIYFNLKKDKAFVSTSLDRGEMGGGDFDIFLEKRNGKWVIIKRNKVGFT
jgi:hypothetical protein